MNQDFSKITGEIKRLIDNWEQKLKELPVKTITEKRNKQNRSIKQILGHLIDSASNNHHRFVRLQYNSELIFPDYTKDNDTWIAIQNYQNENWENLVELWKYFNLHLIHVMINIDTDKLENIWYDGSIIPVSLNNMITGYIEHFKLHLNEIQELIDS
jgi:hypothetical protein